MGKISRFKIEQRIEVDTDSKDILTSQILRVSTMDDNGNGISMLDYRPIVQEVLRIGMKAFKQNCINALYNHFGNQRLVAEALGMQRTYISRLLSQRKRRLKNEKQKLIGGNGNGDGDDSDVIDICPVDDG